MIKEILKHIPDNLNVNDPDVSKDAKAAYLLEEYRNTSWTTEVPPIDANTTFGDIKNTLESLPYKEVAEIINEYQEKFLSDTPPEDDFSKKKMIKIFFYFTLDFVIIILVAALGFGLYTGELSATQIIQSLIEFMGKAFGSIFGGPEPF